MNELKDFMNSSDGAIVGIILIVLVVILFIAMIIKVFEIIYTWKLFKKAGKGGWESLIPIYNKWVLVEISESNWWWFLLLVVPSFISVTLDMTEKASDSTPFLAVIAIISIAVAICAILASLVVSINLAKKFNRSTGFGVLIAFIPIIGIPIIAFGKSEYDFESEVPGNGIFGGSPIKKTNRSNPNIVQSKCEKCETIVDNNMKYCPNCGNKIK